MIRILRNLGRLFVIVRTLGRYNALFADELADIAPGLALIARLLSRRSVPDRIGRRLSAALADLGPTFIKLGQALSIRSDLVGEQIAADLADLRDRLPPFPFENVRAIIEGELGRPLETLYSSFDEKSIAAASIAQVHFAVTAAGEEVAVKVLRPGIEHTFRRDVELFFWLAELALWLQPGLRRLRMCEVVDMFYRTTCMEMDLRMEASAASELAHNFIGDQTFRVPSVNWDLTAQRVLTLERIHGIKVVEGVQMRAMGYDPDRVMAHAASTFFNQVFRDGYFHADLHPGNLFVQSDGSIAAVDFGIMGRLDWATRTYLADMLIGFLTGDYRRVAKVHFQAGYVPAHHSLDVFTQACRAIGEPLLNKPLNEISVGKLLAQLFTVTEQFEMETQPQLLLLQKSMLIAEGVGRTLNPAINMWELARPLIEAWMRENRGPEARVVDELDSILTMARRLPAVVRGMEKTVEMMTGSGLRLHPETVAVLTRSRVSRFDLWLLRLTFVLMLLAVVALWFR
ncbi:putative protein kinase UbiB [Azospirillaceae bacterium]